MSDQGAIRQVVVDVDRQVDLRQRRIPVVQPVDPVHDGGDGEPDPGQRVAEERSPRLLPDQLHGELHQRIGQPLVLAPLPADDGREAEEGPEDRNRQDHPRAQRLQPHAATGASRLPSTPHRKQSPSIGARRCLGPTAPSRDGRSGRTVGPTGCRGRHSSSPPPASGISRCISPCDDSIAATTSMQYTTAISPGCSDQPRRDALRPLVQQHQGKQRRTPPWAASGAGRS